MTDQELIAKIKTSMMVDDDIFDSVILPRMLGVRGYMLNAGISEELIYSDTGIIALIVGTNDLWNLNSGEQKFSQGFKSLVTQLQIKNGQGV